MEEQIQQNPVPEKPKRKFWKFIAGFLAIIIIVGGGFFVWQKYFSPQAKLDRQTQENYQKYLDWQANYEKAMKEDTYGGKTPEETLQMFIDALKKGDVELASKYFILREDGIADPKWKEGLKATKDTGKLQEVAGLLSKARPDLESRSNENDFKFATYENSKLKAYVNLEFNIYSHIWKIESL